MEDIIQESALVRSAADAHGGHNRSPGGSLITESCYCKLLVTNHLAGIIIGQSGNDIRTLKSTTGAKIVLSPHGMHFPGTMERVAAVEGSEQAVFQVLDWFMEKMAEQRTLAELQDQHHLQQQVLQPLQQQDGAAPFALATSKCSTCVRLCVPRAVVGSLIGKNGGYIQSLRVATGASINISPLFVTAEEACAERIVSVDSRRKQCLKTAAFTLIRKINTHPDRASCRHVCYFRKHSFESPLAEPLTALHPCDVRLRHQMHHQHAQQQVHHPQQDAHHDVENVRRKTVSLVMGTARCPLKIPLPPQQERFSISNHGTTGSNTSNNSTVGEKQFAAFKRFCEARIPRNATPSSGQQQQQQNAQAPLSKNMQEVLNSKKQQGVEAEQAAAAAAAAPAAPGVKPSTSWESGISSLCSTAAASTDRLLVLAQLRTTAAEPKEEEKPVPIVPVFQTATAPTPAPRAPPSTPAGASPPPPPASSAAATAGLSTPAAAPRAAAAPPREVPQHVYKRHVRSIAILALIALLMVAVFRLVRTN